MTPAEARCAARGLWEVRVTRGEHEDADEEARFWLRIPEGDRARATWELSWELHLLAAQNGGVLDEERDVLERGALNERRLPRSAFRVERR
ncbi:MAG: hypothetical protein IT375_16725 [Polyangiaceae bacterium]|nr:hypothetical protein [Polyangiaceae bacterium]